VKFHCTILVGLGGTGTHLLEPLARLLAFHQNGTRAWVVADGDAYEQHNQNRQLFDPAFVGRNKAEVAMEKLRAILGEGQNNHVAAIAQYINRESFTEIAAGLGDPKKDNLLVVLAVDNHATRRDIYAALDGLRWRNFVVLDPGNGLDSGEVVCYVKQKGKALTTHPLQKYPDLANPPDQIPDGCAEMAPGAPQLITANALAAVGTLCIIQAMLDGQTAFEKGQPWFEEVKFDARRLKLVPQE
jgi:hypothetical protein